MKQFLKNLSKKKTKKMTKIIHQSLKEAEKNYACNNEKKTEFWKLLKQKLEKMF